MATALQPDFLCIWQGWSIDCLSVRDPSIHFTGSFSPPSSSSVSSSLLFAVYCHSNRDGSPTVPITVIRVLVM